MFKAKTSILRAPLTYVMTLMLLHVQISEALLTPRPPGASVQHCGRALQLTFGKPLAPNLLRQRNSLLTATKDEWNSRTDVPASIIRLSNLRASVAIIFATLDGVAEARSGGTSVHQYKNEEAFLHKDFWNLSSNLSPVHSALIERLTYAPSKVACPEHFGIRQGGHSVGIAERAYNEGRRTQVLTHAYQEYLTNLNTFVASHKDKSLVLPNYLTRILSSKNATELPRFSIAVGAIFAAGIMNAMDGRNASSVQAGTGGLLQIADYITGLSGSAWLVVSWAESELAPLYDLVGGAGKSSRRVGWFTQYNLFDPTASFRSRNFAEHFKKFLLGTKYWSKILDQVIQKGLAGFPISLVDLWGRVLSYHFFLEWTSHRLNSLVATFRKDLASHFQDLSSFQASRTTLSPTPLSPLSTQPDESWRFSQSPNFTPRSINAIIPNPFLGLGTNDFLQRTDQDLELVDGGLGNEVTPYAPLLVGPRRVEVIFAIDGKNDAENYATGSSVIQTAKRVAQLPKAYKFPQVPLNISTYVTEGLASRPTFFGCDEPVDVPLIIWIANSPPIDRSAGVTNTSTVQLSRIELGLDSIRVELVSVKTALLAIVGNLLES
ncbi:hypothetical protein H4Q26_000685 [Puccinia striiformis f. sp. tritici PST-130]|nr:hypothetical protein H4Q26_000685 [Puccinia striiformis f. sp. tritici PST-130]